MIVTQSFPSKRFDFSVNESMINWPLQGNCFGVEPTLGNPKHIWAFGVMPYPRLENRVSRETNKAEFQPAILPPRSTLFWMKT